MDLISATALSFTVSGNTGIAPFLTLFLAGAIERANPDILNMGETMESILSSWFSLSILGILTILESIGHCVPVVDELMDSAVTFVIPIMSILGSLSTFGVLATAEEETDFDENGRQLFLGTVASGFFITFQIIVVIVGVALALSMHLFKMLVRLAGEGWFTQLLTVAEITYVVTTILLAVYIRPFAIVTGGFILMSSGYAFKRRYWDGRKQKDISQAEPASGTEDEVGGDYVNVSEVEASQPTAEKLEAVSATPV